MLLMGGVIHTQTGSRHFGSALTFLLYYFAATDDKPQLSHFPIRTHPVALWALRFGILDLCSHYRLYVFMACGKNGFRPQPNMPAAGVCPCSSVCKTVLLHSHKVVLTAVRRALF